LPRVAELWKRDGALNGNETAPLISPKPGSNTLGMWTATCRVAGIGSGFIVDGGSEGPVVITNAHVVDQCDPHMISVEWFNYRDGHIQHWSAEVIAIDYPHDLAIRRGGSAIQAAPSSFEASTSCSTGSLR
jgi:S1-C subfamily serine protease